MLMVNYEALGKRLKAKRRAAKLSQDQLAKKVQISVSYYGNIERGQRIPSIDTLVALANVLETSVDYLLVDSVIVAKRQYMSKMEMNSRVYHHLREAIAELDYSTDKPDTETKE